MAHVDLPRGCARALNQRGARGLPAQRKKGVVSARASKSQLNRLQDGSERLSGVLAQ